MKICDWEMTSVDNYSSSNKSLQTDCHRQKCGLDPSLSQQRKAPKPCPLLLPTGFFDSDHFKHRWRLFVCKSSIDFNTAWHPQRIRLGWVRQLAGTENRNRLVASKTITIDDVVIAHRWRFWLRSVFRRYSSTASWCDYVRSMSLQIRISFHI